MTVNGPQTTTDTSTATTMTTTGSDTGDDVSGDYADSTTTTNVVDNVNVLVTTSGLTSQSTGTTTTNTTSSDSGNTVTGDSSASSTESDSGNLTKTDNYSDGSDTQAITRTANSSTSSTSNTISGDYSQTTSGSSTTTTTETGSRAGAAYSLNDTKTSNSGNTKSGNNFSGDYSLHSSSSDGETSTRTGTAASGVSFSIVQSTNSTGSADTTGNDFAGDFSTTSSGTITVTTHETTIGAGQSTTLDQTDTTVSSLGETGNTISGDFSSTDHPTITTAITQSGTIANGNFTLTENATDHPTITTTGNSIDGTQAITTTGAQGYIVNQTNTSIYNSYTLTDTGTKTYTRTETDNVTDGTADSTETGTDVYTLNEGGILGDGKNYAQSVTGTAAYATTTVQNSLTGVFSITTTGTDANNRNETGTDASGNAINTTDSGSNSFSSTQVGNTFAGTVSLAGTGSSRYDLLEQFSNTADSAKGGAGMGDFSPVGMPVMVGRASVSAGTFSTIGDAQYEYCFAAGTLVVMADGTRKAIECIEPGEQVLAVPDSDPTAKPRACRVEAVYHNAPALLLSLKVAGQMIRTTANHPFHVKAKGWVEAGNLVPGDRLRTDGGEWVTVERVEGSGRVEAVFNLQVTECHTYFVAGGAAEVAVLVHNESEYRPQAWTDAKQKVAADLHMNTNNWQILQNAYDHNPDFKKAVDAYVPWVEKWYKNEDRIQEMQAQYEFWLSTTTPESRYKKIQELMANARVLDAADRRQAYLSQFPSMRASSHPPLSASEEANQYEDDQILAKVKEKGAGSLNFTEVRIYAGIQKKWAEAAQKAAWDAADRSNAYRIGAGALSFFDPSTEWNFWDFTLVLSSTGRDPSMAARDLADMAPIEDAYKTLQKQLAESGPAFDGPTISVFHKGELLDGQIGTHRTFSTGIDPVSVAALDRSGPVNEFKIPKNVFAQWLLDGKVGPIRDLDKATGVYNDGWVFNPSLADELNQYKVNK